MVSIPVPAGNSVANDINNSGQIVGSSNGVAFRYSADTDSIEYFYAPDGTDTSVSASAINEHSHFVGKAQFVTPKGKNNTDHRAYVYRGGADLEDLGAPQYLSSSGVNNYGDVVLRNSVNAADGMVYVRANSGAVYHELVNDALFKLDDAVTGSEADLQTWHSADRATPLDINDWGQIAGRLTMSFGVTQGFILTPIAPAP